MTATQITDFRDRARFLKNLFPTLTVSLCGSWIWITGDTKPFKEKLREQGCKWTSKKEKWYLKGRPCSSKKSMSWSYIVTKYGREEIEEVAA